MNHRSDIDFSNEGSISKIAENQTQLRKDMRIKNRIPQGKPKLKKTKMKTRMNHKSDIDSSNEGSIFKIAKNKTQLTKCMRTKNRIPKGKPKLENQKRKQG